MKSHYRGENGYPYTRIVVVPRRNSAISLGEGCSGRGGGGKFYYIEKNVTLNSRNTCMVVFLCTCQCVSACMFCKFTCVYSDMIHTGYLTTFLIR